MWLSKHFLHFSSVVLDSANSWSHVMCLCLRNLLGLVPGGWHACTCSVCVCCTCPSCVWVCWLHCVHFLYVILDLFFEVKLVVVHNSQICLLQFIRGYILYCYSDVSHWPLTGLVDSEFTQETKKIKIKQVEHRGKTMLPQHFAFREFGRQCPFLLAFLQNKNENKSVRNWLICVLSDLM